MLQLRLQEHAIFAGLPRTRLDGFDVLVSKPGDFAPFLALVDGHKVAFLFPGMNSLVSAPLISTTRSLAEEQSASVLHLLADRYLHTCLLPHRSHGAQSRLQLLIRLVEHGFEILNLLRLLVALLSKLINLPLSKQAMSASISSASKDAEGFQGVPRCT